MKDFIKVLGGNIVANGFGFLAILIVARTLGVASYGIFSVLFSFYMVLGQLFDFGFSVSFVKIGSDIKANDDAYKTLFTTTFILRVIISFIGIAIVYPLSKYIAYFLFENYTYLNQIQFIILSAPLYPFFLFMLSFFQAKQIFHIYSIINASYYLLRLLAISFIALYLTQSGEMLILYNDIFILAYAIVFLLSIIYIYILYPFKIKKLFSFKYAKELLSLGFWASLSAAIVILILRVDIFMLEKISTSHAAGLYSAALQVAMVFPLITSALFITVFPKAQEYIKEHSLDAFITKSLSLYKYVLPLLCIVEIFAYFFFPILYGHSYHKGTYVLMVLLISFSLEIFINPLISLFYLYKKTYLYFAIILIQLFLNILGNLYLIPMYHEIGAAISTTLARSAGLILITYFVFSFKKK